MKSSQYARNGYAFIIAMVIGIVAIIWLRDYLPTWVVYLGPIALAVLIYLWVKKLSKVR